MPYHATQRVALTAAVRQAVAIPSDGIPRQMVTIGNATPDDLKIDMGDANHYAVIIAGGYHDIKWPVNKPTPIGAPDGIAFYATALATGTMVLEWT